MTSLRMPYEVTQEDIDNGIPTASAYCPHGLGIRRELKANYDVTGRHGQDVPDFTLHVHLHTAVIDTGDGSIFGANLDARVVDWIDRSIRGLPVEPGRFSVTWEWEEPNQ